MSVVAGIGGGVVANFLFGVAKDRAPDRLKRLVPALFFGGPLSAAEIDHVFSGVVEQILDKYSSERSVHLFLSPEKTFSGGVLNPLFRNIFLEERLDNKALENNFRACIHISEWRSNPKKYQQILDDIVRLIRRSLLANQATATFALNTSMSEVKDKLDKIESICEKWNQFLPEYGSAVTSSPVDEFSKEYFYELRERTKDTYINGLEMITKKPEFHQKIMDSYISLYLKGIDVEFGKSSGQSEESFGASEIIRDCRRIIVRGPAGCGKTTLLQWIIWNCDPFNDFQDNPSKLKFFPIYIPLRRLEQLGTQSYTIRDVIFNTLPSDSLRPAMPVSWIRSVMTKGVEVILLIDGLDEVPENRRRDVWTLVKSIATEYPSVRMLLTSRHVSAVHVSDGSYRSDILQTRELYEQARQLWNKPDDFFEFVVSPLNDGEIFDLIDKWYAGVDPDFLRVEDQERVGIYPEYLKDELFKDQNKPIKELARTPLLGSLICMSFLYSRGHLPTSKREIYDYSVSLMISIRDEARRIGVPQKFFNFTVELRTKLLKDIALIMQEGVHQGERDQTVEVDKSKVLEWISGWLMEHKQLSGTADDYLGFLIDRCSIIREPSYNRIDFIHRSFMEFLAAEQISQTRRPEQIRDRILRDEWTNTLHFCMSTKAGGSYFGSLLIREMFDYVKNGTQKKTTRPTYLKIISMLNSFTEDQLNVNETVREIFGVVAPLQDSGEVDECLSVPASVLANFLDFGVVTSRYDQNELREAVSLLARHKDFATKDILLTGYEKLPDKDIIRIINYSGKLTVSEHTALNARIRNRSYTEPVFLTANELRDIELRSALINSAWIRFPIEGDSFVGWDYLYRTKEVKFSGITISDFKIMSKSINVRRFDSCEVLIVQYGSGFSLGDVYDLLPNVKTISIQNCNGVSLAGMEKFSQLSDIWIENCSQKIQVSSSNVPESLDSIIFFRSESPDFLDETVRPKVLIETSENTISRSRAS
ncbi:NACHT domain-containing protein [Thalassobaculum salexigens]|uniref:NACHT domain-containing protein n=1 Tax=Thalassobaculum salexigens TaxID=455360 RepID=UPI0003F5BC2D|nr:NACHT domain-containing protein [Thalassobaculum salexigens]